MNTEEVLVTMPGTSDTTENEADKTPDCKSLYPQESV